ncbi:hypothetical protein SETIT_3G330500v2 [Setaria italica]|uniref:Peptidase A1 domain-containing protein n=1 Tax=Setaria italica TaxID=4555 RepID=K3ZDM5_SETIT|nr:aspartic proteinase nepenthesin-1 [Setaria italica]RCV18777.1 hypothetical protein SETIT_3G330500v2 [Setaria italica]
MANPLIWLALFCASLSSFATSAAGLRLELTHVDAKDNCTAEERLRRATERTHRRLASMGGVGVAAPVRWSETQYVAEYLIGDPPQRAEAIVDTGSDLVWTQCSACRAAGCFAQNLPYYDPSRSRTAQPAACGDAACALGSVITQCTRAGEACAVAVRYGAGDIVGFLRTETFAFGSEEVSLAFGCVVATELSPGSLDGASGIIGLGRGALSLVSQLGDTRFSYCLTPYLRDAAKPSHLFVGASADLSGGAPVTSVPFARNPNEYPFSTFYYLPLVGMSVGTARLAIAAAAFELRRVAAGVWAGGSFIDSGSPFTTLVDAAYQALRAELVRQLGASLVQPRTGGLDLCVARGDAGRVVPPLVLHFGGGGGGGDVVVPPENYWGPVDGATECMLVFNSAAGPDSTLPLNETTIIGNYMQQDVHLLYDLDNGVLSFQTADCSSM